MIIYIFSSAYWCFNDWIVDQLSSVFAFNEWYFDKHQAITIYPKYTEDQLLMMINHWFINRCNPKNQWQIIIGHRGITDQKIIFKEQAQNRIIILFTSFLAPCLLVDNYNNFFVKTGILCNTLFLSATWITYVLIEVGIWDKFQDVEIGNIHKGWRIETHPCFYNC